MSHAAVCIKKALVGFETSGKTREELRKRGVDAWSCDILPADDGSPYHYQCDIFEALDAQDWDLVILHPPCTFLAGSGLHWNKRDRARAKKTEEAIKFVLKLVKWIERRIKAKPGFKACIENPVGCLSSRYRKPDQIIQPYWFGDNASKKTCLWLFGGLRKLVPTKYRRPPMLVAEIVKGAWRVLSRWGNQTESGQNALGPSEDRWKKRSETYDGIASAFAAQWVL